MKNKESPERAGQEGLMAVAELQKEHRWLQKLLGEWTFKGSATMAQDKPPEKFEGTESVRPLGELWILAEAKGDMPCAGPATTMMTLGYNPQKKRFVGTFIGSMMPHLWLYDGALDAAGNVLTLDSEGPDMEGKMVKFQDVIEVKNEDHRVLTSRMLGEDGKWLGIVTANYRRRK
jgi:hypothetical protein